MKVQDLINQIRVFYPHPEEDVVLGFHIKGSPVPERGESRQIVEIRSKGWPGNIPDSK